MNTAHKKQPQLCLASPPAVASAAGAGAADSNGGRSSGSLSKLGALDESERLGSSAAAASSPGLRRLLPPVSRTQLRRCLSATARGSRARELELPPPSQPALHAGYGGGGATAVRQPAVPPPAALAPLGHCRERRRRPRMRPARSAAHNGLRVHYNLRASRAGVSRRAASVADRVRARRHRRRLRRFSQFARSARRYNLANTRARMRAQTRRRTFVRAIVRALAAAAAALGWCSGSGARAPVATLPLGFSVRLFARSFVRSLGRDASSMSRARGSAESK